MDSHRKASGNRTIGSVTMSEEERVRELSRFLKERRARIRPADVGLPASGRRRVAGLRREEVASLAGIGVSWYTSLENGEATGVSEATLTTVAEALRLSESEREYLLALAGLSQVTERPSVSEPLIVATLRAIAFPAYIINATWDILEYNEAFRRVWAIRHDEEHFNAVDRLFLQAETRKMHGPHLTNNPTQRPACAPRPRSRSRRPPHDLERVRNNQSALTERLHHRFADRRVSLRDRDLVVIEIAGNCGSSSGRREPQTTGSWLMRS